MHCERMIAENLKVLFVPEERDHVLSETWSKYRTNVVVRMNLSGQHPPPESEQSLAQISCEKTTKKRKNIRQNQNDGIPVDLVENAASQKKHDTGRNYFQYVTIK